MCLYVCVFVQLCTEQRWVSLRLDGNLSVKKRQELVDTFNDPTHPSFLLLLSSKAGGVGLNIIGANRLILFDPGGYNFAFTSTHGPCSQF